VVVAGDPQDGAAQVTVFVRDTAPPHNMLANSISVGGSVLFENLGAGFDIEVGIRDLGAHRCVLLGNSRPGGASPSVIIATTSGVTDSVVFTVRCTSGSVTLVTSGLPPNDSAVAAIVSPAHTALTPKFTNGTFTLHVVPDAATSIQPFAVTGSDGFVYTASAQTVAVRTGQTTTVQIAYAVSAPSQGSIAFAVSGVPPDSGILLWAFVRGRSAPFTRDSALIPLGRSFRFGNIPRGVALDVGLEGLATHVCGVVNASVPYTESGGRATGTLTTATNGINFVTFTLRCRSGLIDLEVSGLPPGDSASVSIVAVIDTLTVRAANGRTTVASQPDVTTAIVPQSVTGSDGRTYQSPPQTVNVQSRLTTLVQVPYTAPAAACRFDQPYAWYAMNGNAMDSAGRVHGTLPGGGAAPQAASDRRATAASAFAFDGVDDHIDVGDNFNLGLPVSIALWAFQPGSARQPNVFRSLFASDDEPGRYAGFWLGLTPTGNLSYSYGNGGPVGATSRRTINSDNPIPTDQWVHLVATMRGPTDMALYVNGALVAATYDGTGAGILHSGAPARIASYSLIAANAPWAGTLDELRVYNCSLDAAEAAALYQVP
jgi:hypothetical protein